MVWHNSRVHNKATEQHFGGTLLMETEGGGLTTYKGESLTHQMDSC